MPDKVSQLGTNESLTVSVRKIDNGYVKTVSTYGDSPGAYSSKETFSALYPGMGAEPKDPSAPRTNSLRGAISDLARAAPKRQK